uniref:Sialic acid-binding Ig-like lectin 14 n=1 Tax=Callorhinus ursinus TaxID=34884 RepID=A0A3Q7MFH8_CALUR|nr:sialic acid-binding Ig-like lectin 14 [Callorhinus ursinus]
MKGSSPARLSTHWAPSTFPSASLCRGPPSAGTPSSCNCVTEKQEGSWPLVLTLIRGALMGAGFLLTPGLTWIYYTRCGDPPGSGAERPD